MVFDTSPDLVDEDPDANEDHVDNEDSNGSDDLDFDRVDEKHDC